MCKIAKISRAGFYKWLHRKTSVSEDVNRKIAEIIEAIHKKMPEKGYRSINDVLNREHDIHVNDKRILRICRIQGIKSTIKYSNKGCTINSANPQHLAENILGRRFIAEAPNQKWLTDVENFNILTEYLMRNFVRQ